jgi:hypothetical protein
MVWLRYWFETNMLCRKEDLTKFVIFERRRNILLSDQHVLKTTSFVEMSETSFVVKLDKKAKKCQKFNRIGNCIDEEKYTSRDIKSESPKTEFESQNQFDHVIYISIDQKFDMESEKYSLKG